MGSNEEIYFTADGAQLSNNEQTDNPSKKPYVIGLIVFIVLAILITIFALWWFIWRDSNDSRIRSCTGDTQCLPNEVCNNGVCNAVQCVRNSDCNNVANGEGGSVCVGSLGSDQPGYCQTATCESNTDCLDLGDDFICASFQPDVSTPWINSACVRSGNTCNSDKDCYGGSSGLFCNIGDGENSGVCQQCRNNGDCTGNQAGFACISGVCAECNPDDPDNPLTPSTQCGGDNVCANHTCCSDPQYTVNGVPSCKQGEIYDTCLADGDCKSGTCGNLGTPTGSMTPLRVCVGGPMVFSFGSKLDIDGIDISDVTCDSPNGLNDTTARPFAVNGACQLYGATLDDVNGSACGLPSFCRLDSHSNNLACTGQLTFENPFATICTNDDDCSGLGNGWGCGTDNICGPPCTKSSDCAAGLVCDGNGICGNPTSRITCDPLTECIDDDSPCPCPSGYACSGSAAGGTCTWAAPDDGSQDSPPPPVIIDTVCARPATAVSDSKQNQFISSYCVNGYCNTRAGWINSTCNQDDDCTFLGNTGGARELSCVQDNRFPSLNVCSKG